jgi:hypothetical protein
MQPTPNSHAFMFTLIMLFSVVNLRGLSMKLIAQSYPISNMVNTMMGSLEHARKPQT